MKSLWRSDEERHIRKRGLKASLADEDDHSSEGRVLTVR